VNANRGARAPAGLADAPLTGRRTPYPPTSIVGTLATTAIITEPADVRLHIDMLGSLTDTADFDNAACETPAELRSGYLG
jgi:hypothetical protein